MLPGLAQLGALAAILAVLVALSGLGALACGRARSRAADLAAGWGIVTIVLTLAGLWLPGSLKLAGWACLGAGWLAAGWMVWRRALVPAGLGWALLFMAPLILMVAAMEPSQWDEFSQWLYSALYLFDHAAFPTKTGPEFVGSFAAYPFANAFPSYLASLLAGRFLENAGAIVNLFVCLSFALALAELIAEARGKPDLAGHPGIVALALIAATLANPTFVAKIVFTAYADAPTALALTLVGLAGWRMLSAEQPLRPALQAGLCGAMLLSLKQANLVLFLLALIGLAVVALRLGRLRALAWLAVAALPALIPYVAWRGHVAANFPGNEFVVRPVAQWALDLVPEVLSGMAYVASNKGGHFGVLVVVLVLAVRALWRMRTQFDRLVVVACAVGVGYNAFLLFAYVTAFDRGEAQSVASYWRYNMHVGEMAWAALVFGLAGLWRWRVHKAASLVLPALVVAAPLATHKHFRFDLHAGKRHVREVGAELRGLIPAGARLSVVDPSDPGFYPLLMKYMVHGRAGSVDRLYINQPPDTPEAIAKRLDGFGPTHAWVHIPTPATRIVFGLPLPDRASYLLARDGAGWALVKSWPYPGYANPHDLKD